LAYVLLVERRPVEPHYLITVDRPSFATEIRTMARIKQLLRGAHSVTRDRLLPVRFTDVRDLTPDETTEKQLQALKANGYIGLQYEYLARYATQMHLDDLELSVHKGGRVLGLLSDSVQRIESDGGFVNYRLHDPRDPGLLLFRRFRFPLRDVTKVDMGRLAASHGFSDVMEQTWFCHKPLAGDVPCGRCRPCGYAVEEGMGRRLPWRSRLRYEVRRARRRFRDRILSPR
jgi:hypothetical protein